MKTKFFKLRFGERFIHAGKILQKESTFRAVTSYGWRAEVTVWPWTRVRIVTPESDPFLFLLARFEAETAKALSRPSPFIDLLTGGKFLEGAGRDSGRTHYFGDGCYPPHVEGQLDAYKADEWGWNKYRDDERTGPSA